MPNMRSLTYHELTRWRGEAGQFGYFLDLPVVPHAYEMCRRLDKGGKLLDVGAGVRHYLQESLAIEKERYFTLDDDPRGEFDFGAFSDIPQDMKFDLVTMNQLLEHLTVDETYEILKAAREVLAPDGVLFVSVPNAMHPVRWNADVTHQTNWNYRDLYGLMRHLGFTVHHIYRANKGRLTRNPLKRWVINVVCRNIRIDWCDSILIIAGKSDD